MDRILEGGCLCGAVRYLVKSAPSIVTHCHCGMCRRAAGATLVTWAVVKTSDYTVTRGQPAAYRSSPKARRTFCGDCGAQLTFQYDARPDTIDVSVGSFDDPNAVKPDDHVWVSDRIGWLSIDDGLPQLPKGH